MVDKYMTPGGNMIFPDQTFVDVRQLRFTEPDQGIGIGLIGSLVYDMVFEGERGALGFNFIIQRMVSADGRPVKHPLPIGPRFGDVPIEHLWLGRDLTKYWRIQ